MHRIIFDKSEYRYSSAALASNGGTVVAAAVRCSQNIDKGITWGYSEIVAKVSADGGETFGNEIKIAAPPARKITAEEGNMKSAFFLNPVLLSNKSGEFVMVVTFYPESMGSEEDKLLDKRKAAYTYFDGKNMPIIYDRDGNYYIICDDGKVLDSAKNATDYTVRGFGELYSGEEYIGNIYLNGAMGKSDGHKTTFGAPLKAPKRSYIMMLKSADGVSWSEPRDITQFIQNEADGVCIETSRGSGDVSESGRLFVPLTNDKGATCIYSLDGGEIWSRNQRMPYMPMKDDGVSIVQLPTGELLALGRKWCISHDKGITWIKDKAKAAPSDAILDGEKLLAVIDSPKTGTHLLIGDVKIKGNKYKGVKFDKSSTASTGDFFPSTALARVNGGLAVLNIDPYNQQVVFNIF